MGIPSASKLPGLKSNGRMGTMDELVFLKLGGSLITEKTEAYTPRLKKLAALAREIRDALGAQPTLRLILGHGSGSFGHYAVRAHLDASPPAVASMGRARTDTAYWNGFAEVWYRASQLNRHVVDALHEAGVPVISLSPSSAAVAAGGRITSWDLEPLRAALKSGVLPIIFGDIVFDGEEGGKVLSTEVLMRHLARDLGPQRILLAGLEEAVWADFPHRSLPIDKITPSTFATLGDKVGASHGPDVTGGMRSKVVQMLGLVAAIPGLSVRIFSGEEPGNVAKALSGEGLGTLIASD